MIDSKGDFLLLEILKKAAKHTKVCIIRYSPEYGNLHAAINEGRKLTYPPEKQILLSDRKTTVEIDPILAQMVSCQFYSDKPVINGDDVYS